MSMYVLFLILRPCFVSFAGAKVRRFFKLANFLTSFFEVFFELFFKWLVFRRCFVKRMGVMGVMGREPHGQVWE